jgi:hypothetical protein
MVFQTSGYRMTTSWVLRCGELGRDWRKVVTFSIKQIPPYPGRAYYNVLLND